MLHEAVPNAAVIGALINPSNPNAEANTREAQEAARTLGLELHVLNASTEQELDAAFTALIQRHVEVLVIDGDPFFAGQLEYLVALTLRHAMPATSLPSAISPTPEGS
jgi:putative tryptophan/tyrosine transport system substrate-binding protein